MKPYFRSETHNIFFRSTWPHYDHCITFPCYLEPVSLARTILAYRANDRDVMSFGVNVDVKVFSKGSGKRTDLWGIEVYFMLSFY